jgi:endoglucanase
MEIKKENKELLGKILETRTPSGHEGELREVIKGIFGSTETDQIGNIYFGDLSKNPESSCITIMLSAHIDEVGFMVSSVTAQGFLKIVSAGGIDPKVLQGSTVKVLGKNGSWIPGVIGKAPIHTERGPEREKAPGMSDLLVDIGVASKKEALGLVRIGAYGVPDSTPNLEFGPKKDMIVSRGLDDKAGIYVVIRAVQELKEALKGTSARIIGVGCVQEEAGLRGAGLAVQKVRPDVSIDLDVTFASDEGRSQVKEEVYGDVGLGSGPVICYGGDKTESLVELIRGKAEMPELGLSYQEIATRPGGTNTSKIQTGWPCKTALLSIPLRNMHTQTEIVSWSDLEQTVTLLKYTCIALVDEILDYGVQG